MRYQGVNPGEHPEAIIVGLGNPGARYEDTRHNIGFKIIDYIDEKSAVSVGLKRMLHHALVDKVVLDGRILYLVKPQTYMNNSGIAVKDVMRYYRMTPDKLVVIHDDITLPVGHFKIKNGGSAGGHNGIQSIIDHLGSKDFIRIKVGIGAKPEGWDLANHVLARIPENEFKLIHDKFDMIKRAVASIYNYNLQHAMTVYNALGCDKQI